MSLFFLSLKHVLVWEEKRETQPLCAFGSSWHRQFAECRQKEESEDEKGGVTFYSVTFSKCSRRNLPFVTLSLLGFVSFRRNQRFGCCQTRSPFKWRNPQQPSYFLDRGSAVVYLPRAPWWDCAGQWRSPHTERGGVKGDRLEVTCWVWPHINTHLIHLSSVFIFSCLSPAVLILHFQSFFVL